MRRRMNGWFAVLLVPVMACHRPREMAPQIPLDGIDGKYTFSIQQPFKMEGRFLVTYAKAYMIEPRRCVPIEGPKSSDALRASWFECVAGSQGRPSGASLRLRISEVDPVNLSRWYQQTTALDTVERCTAWQNGRCVQGVRAVRRERTLVDRSGAVTVVKGWPVSADTSAAPNPQGRGQLRIRCDTSCQPNKSREP